MAHNVADNQDGGVARPFHGEVEVAGDPLSSGDESRRKLHTGTRGELWWRQRVTNRAQIRELLIGGPQPLSHVGQLTVADTGLRPQLRDHCVGVFLLVLMPA